MRKNLFLFPLLFLLATLLCNAQVDKESNFYTPPANKGIYRVFNGVNGDDTNALQNLINLVTASSDGGRIYIPKGTYHFNRVKLKSNVTILIDELATIKLATPKDTKTPTIFELGETSIIKNVSIVAIKNKNERATNPNNPALTGRFTVDLTSTNESEVFVFFLGGVTNFKLSNFNVKDKLTKFQSVGLDFKRIGGNVYVPRNGVVSNASVSNAAYGYGLVQVQAAKKVLFKNLTGHGGVTLRLETGFSQLQRVTPASAIRLNNIYGRNIKCTQGQAVVHISPHTIDQGFFDVRNLKAINCEWGIFIEKGFTRTSEVADGLTPGSFNKNSIVKDVYVTSGNSATIRGQHLRFLPCSKRNNVKIFPIEHEKATIYTTPSLAGVYYESFSESRANGGFKINLSNVTATGFYKDPNNSVNNVPAVITNGDQDFENCAIGGNYYIPNIYKNTPRKQYINNKSTQFEKNNNATIANKTLTNNTLNYKNDSVLKNIELYDINGTLIKSFTNTSINDIKNSIQLPSEHVYILKILNDGDINIKKIVF